MSAAKQNWPRVKLGEVCEEIHERIASSEIAVDTYVTTDNMLKNCAGVSVAEYVPDGVGLVRYEKGDVLLANIRPYLKKLWRATHDGGCSSDVVVFRSRLKELSSEYLFAALSQDRFFDYVMLKPRGTKMPRGDRDWMKNFEFPLPPLPVQREIVARLERELGAVDELAKKFDELEQTAEAEFKAELKETFEEVSRGGAETRRLGEVCEIVSGKTPLRSNSSFWCNGTVPWFTIDDLRTQGMEIRTTEQFITEDATASMRVVPADTVLLCCTASIGACCIARIPLTTNQQFNALITREKGVVTTEYLYYLCLGLTPVLGELSSRTTIDFVSKTKVENIEIVLPPLPVQRAIVARLDAAKTRKEALVSAAKRGRETAALWRKAILKEAFE